ncbi:unnamed protein product, partial [Mesorhabditis belari]|uniref:C2H2-type domain-containing protein n=1 Tax=Mesorhabditis belari TaxID=2138241 RepID=A0AAF3FGL0_9BILA
MGYAVLVTLHEDTAEAKVEEILAQIVCIDGVNTVTTEWRSDRKRRNEPDSIVSPTIDVEEKVEKVHKENETSSAKKSKAQKSNSVAWTPASKEKDDKPTKQDSLRKIQDQKQAEKDFDQKLALIFGPSTPKKFLSPKKRPQAATPPVSRPSSPSNFSPSLQLQSVKTPKPHPDSFEYVMLKMQARDSGNTSRSKSPEDDKENVKSRKSTPQREEIERRVNCAFCLTPTNVNGLRWHALIHCGRKLYSCKLCPFETNNVHSMRNHINGRHAEEPTININYKYNMDEDLKTKWIQASNKAFPDHSSKCEQQIRNDTKRF